MGRRIRVLRVIARLNMGGPAHHVALLSGELDTDRYETLLVSGRVGSGEASLESVAARHGADLRLVPALGPEIRPHRDAAALARLVSIVRGFRPDIVHTHTAKAGMLGRLAALAMRPRPAIVHTYHGHVLEGYFGPVQTALYRGLERRLARVSDRLIGVSQATVDDLVRLGIAPSEKFRVIPIGLDLQPFLEVDRDAGAEFRRQAGAGVDDVLLVWVGRLVPIKRVDVLLRALAAVDAPVRLALVGDGPLRGQLEALAADLGVSGRVHFVGYRSELGPVAQAADVAVLSSDNEGTPVWLVEAAAAARPAVATRVGGVADVVTPATGLLVSAGAHDALAAALTGLARDRDRRVDMGAQAREHVRERFSAARLLRDVDALYRETLPAPGQSDRRAGRGTQ